MKLVAAIPPAVELPEAPVPEDPEDLPPAVKFAAAIIGAVGFQEAFVIEQSPERGAEGHVPRDATLSGVARRGGRRAPSAQALSLGQGLAVCKSLILYHLRHSSGPPFSGTAG